MLIVMLFVTFLGIRFKRMKPERAHWLLVGANLLVALAAWGAGHLRLEFVAPRQARTEAELIEEFRNRPEMQACLRLLNANIEHCTESNQGDTHA